MSESENERDDADDDRRFGLAYQKFRLKGITVCKVKCRSSIASVSRVRIPKFRSSIAPVSLAEYRPSIPQVSGHILEYRTRSAGHSVMRAIFERYFGIVMCDTLTILWGDSRLTESMEVSSTEERVQVKGGPSLAMNTAPNTMGLRLLG